MSAPRHPTVCIETHGCKLNQADSQELARRFLLGGYRLVAEAKQADVYVLNTCTVTHMADRGARHALAAARRLNPGALIVATGCYAQRAFQQQAQVEWADLVLGNSAKPTLVEHVTGALGLQRVPCATAVPGIEGERDNGEDCSARALRRVRAIVKVQEGCDQVCAFCIVPKVRGRERSVPLEEVVPQVRSLVEQGCQEIVLTGTQPGAYGLDLPHVNLAALLKVILDKTNVSRVRVSSLQPQELTPDLLGLWRDKRLCPHFHLPLQSGSGAVLRAMRRRYSPGQYAEAVKVIRHRVPGAAVTADVMAGFPGETEELFWEGYRFCQGLELADLHVFPYSVRPGTSAAHFQAQVPAPVKRQRVALLLALAQQESALFRQSVLGSVRPVLWERSVPSPSAEGQGSGESTVWSGLTDTYVRVLMESPQPLRNRITPVVLARVEGGVVWARPV